MHLKGELVTYKWATIKKTQNIFKLGRYGFHNNVILAPSLPGETMISPGSVSKRVVVTVQYVNKQNSFKVLVSQS